LRICLVIFVKPLFVDIKLTNYHKDLGDFDEFLSFGQFYLIYFLKI